MLHGLTGTGQDMQLFRMIRTLHIGGGMYGSNMKSLVILCLRSGIIRKGLPVVVYCSYNRRTTGLREMLKAGLPLA